MGGVIGIASRMRTMHQLQKDMKPKGERACCAARSPCIFKKQKCFHGADWKLHVIRYDHPTVFGGSDH